MQTAIPSSAIPAAPQREVFSRAAQSFARAFVSALIVLAPGILAAPNLNRAVALGIAAVMASIAAGLKAVQVFVPHLSVAHYFPNWIGSLVDSFLRAFVAAFLTSVIGILNMPTLNGGKSLVVGALVGAFAAGLRAVQGALTKGESPFPSAGITD